MKKFIAGLGLVLSFGVMAKPVFIYPTCFASGATGQCTLYNSSDEVVTCNVQVQAYTRKGMMVTGFQYVTLYQRMSAWVSVYATNPAQDPLASITGNAFCNTAN